MRCRVFFCVAAGLLSSLLATGPALALTLHEAYDLALKQSEDIVMKKELLNEAEARFYRAFAGVTPKVNYLITHQEQDAPEGVSSEGVAGSLLRQSTPQQKFVFSQPIFTGFKEQAAIAGAGLEKKQRELELARAKELLFIDVMEAFYAVRQSEKDEEILSESRLRIKNRVRDLVSRARIGRSRDSEVQAALSDLRTTEAELHEARSLTWIYRQLLEFYIGKDLEGGLSEDEENSELVLELDKKEVSVRSARRSDVKAAEAAKGLAEKNVTIARSRLYPSVKLDGNYYTERVGTQKDVDWDVLFTVDVPVFKGTQTAGEIKEAAAQRERAKAEFEKSKRLATLEIRNAYEKLKASHARHSAFRQAARHAGKNYELNTLEYRRQLVSNLDVLEALKKYQEVLRQWNAAHFEMRKNYWKLRAAAGDLPMETHARIAK
ncbi:MAG: TolC family protein [Candidatus Omnitrophica bacterium]|nr:TolC family protein [Candidatus Omnitrophota bacterium]